MPTQPITELMTRDPTCATPQTPIVEVARMMLEEDCGLIPVVENLQDYRLVGVITDRDIVCRVIARDMDPGGTMAHQAMTENVATLGEDASVDDCVRVMAEYQVRRVPILTGDGRLAGIVAQADLARASVDDAELEDELAEAVEEISQPTGSTGG
jgi:CBS domain-containing protein